MRPPTGNRITQGQHLSSKAVDYSYSPDPYVYAPEDGTIDSYQRRGSGKSDAGNCLRMNGAHGLHQFAHLAESYVKPGQRVTKGQRLAKMGDTGYAFGAHLHYWIKTPKGYVYPPNLTNEPFGGSQGGSEMANTEQVKQIYRAVLFREGDSGGIKHYTGQDANAIVSSMLSSAERKTVEAKYNAPPKEVIKEVRVEVPKEVIKEVPVEKVVTKEVIKEIPGKTVVEPPSYFSAGDLLRALLHKVVAWFKKK